MSTFTIIFYVALNYNLADIFIQFEMFLGEQ